MTQEQLRMQMLAGIITESQYKAKLNEDEENPKPDFITIGFYNQDKFINQYKTGNEFVFHSKEYKEGNWGKLLDGRLVLQDGYYYPIFRYVTDLSRWKESERTEGFEIIYLGYFKEKGSSGVSIYQSNTPIHITGRNSEDRFESLVDARKRRSTEFKKLEAGEVDDIGYFEIISVK